MLPPDVCAVLTRWGEGLKERDLSNGAEHCLGPDSNDWAAVRYLQDTRACDAFAAFLLPFVRDALGDGFSLYDTRLRGGSSFYMAYVDGRSMAELRFFNRIDIEELEINAYAVLLRPVQLRKE
jgi:hypothetical protein